MTTTEKITGTKAVGQRLANAQIDFVENIQSQFGFTKAESQTILAVYVKVKAVKLDFHAGKYNLTHGAFWSKDVMQNALAQGTKNG